MENISDYEEIVDVIKSSGGDAFKRCFQCGLCDVVCPWNQVRQFSMRKIVRQATFGMTDIENEDIWLCTTCGKCPDVCPRDVRQIESGVALRRIATEYGVFAPTARPVSGVSASLAAKGNPLNEAREKRAEWAVDSAVGAFDEAMEMLFFPGCYLSYDPRLKQVARAIAHVLTEAGITFGILGEKESCCGESIRKTGDEQLFKRLARNNIKAFIDSGVTKILVASPHCYHTFKNEYPQFMVHFDVLHITQLLWQLLQADRFELGGTAFRKAAYHDPCYLGRHNGIYEAPRRVLQQIPGLDLVELPDTLDDSLCCGGGGGRIWMETEKGQRFSDLRLKQALDVGADVLVTACPYCIANFEDSRLTLNMAEQIVVKDISEMIAAAIQPS